MCLAVPGKVMAVEGEGLERRARVDFGGVVREASLAFEPEADVGSYVIVHVGVAIGIMDEDEANRVFEHLREMDQLGGAETLR